jgi:hypothetical protein
LLYTESHRFLSFPINPDYTHLLASCGLHSIQDRD